MVMVPHCVPARSPRTRRSLSLAASVDMHAPFQLGEGKPSAATDYVSPTNLYETPPPGHVVIDMTGSLSGVRPVTGYRLTTCLGIIVSEPGADNELRDTLGAACQALRIMSPANTRYAKTTISSSRVSAHLASRAGSARMWERSWRCAGATPDRQSSGRAVRVDRGAE